MKNPESLEVLPQFGYGVCVAQILNLLYRRFVIGRTLLAGGRWQVKNLRYSGLQGRGQAGTLNTYHGWRYNRKQGGYRLGVQQRDAALGAWPQ